MIESFGNLLLFLVSLKMPCVLILPKFQKLTIRIWMYSIDLLKKNPINHIMYFKTFLFVQEMYVNNCSLWFLPTCQISNDWESTKTGIWELCTKWLPFAFSHLLDDCGEEAIYKYECIRHSIMFALEIGTMEQQKEC